MARERSVSPEVSAQIMGLAAEHSNREIANILSKQGIKLSHVTIGKVVNECRSERSGQTKQVVSEYIAKTVVTDLEILERQRDQLFAWFNNESLRISERLMCSDRLNKVIDTRLKYSGADPDDKDKVVVNLFDPETRRAMLRKAANEP